MIRAARRVEGRSAGARLTGFAIPLLLSGFGVAEAQADTFTHPLLHIGSSAPSGASFTGEGYVNLRGSGFEGSLFEVGFDHGGSRVAMNTMIDGLSGASIASAVLTFEFAEQSGGAGPFGLTVTSFDADGTLGYFHTPPSNLGTAMGTIGLGSNNVEVTEILVERVASGSSWFGLHLRSDTAHLWTNINNVPDAALVRLVVTTLGFLPESIYWIDSGTGRVKRASYSGSSPPAVIQTASGHPRFDIAVDEASGFIFWTEGTGAASRIMRASLSGTETTSVQGTSISDPTGIALAPIATSIYWIDSGTGEIKRASYSGSSPPDVIQSSSGSPRFDIAVDEANGLIFWTEGTGAASRIMRASLSGTETTSVQGTSISDPTSVAIARVSAPLPAAPGLERAVLALLLIATGVVFVRWRAAFAS